MSSHGLAFSAAALVLMTSTLALADSTSTCLDAASSGQRLRNAHKLLEAREQFRLCAVAACPGMVQGDCANWLAEVEKAIPTVVLSAKTSTGADLVDVRVSVDGHPLLKKLDGQAVPINAGLHTFRFEGADGTPEERQVMVAEGDKNRTISAVLGAGAPAQALGASTERVPEGTHASTDSTHTSTVWKTVGWVLGGVGVAGLGIGAGFGVVALTTKNADCSGTVCAPNTTGGIQKAALASDVGWIAGGVLLASGAALVLFAPTESRNAALHVKIAPTFVGNAGGAIVAGSW